MPGISGSASSRSGPRCSTSAAVRQASGCSSGTRLCPYSLIGRRTPTRRARGEHTSDIPRRAERVGGHRRPCASLTLKGLSVRLRPAQSGLPGIPEVRPTAFAARPPDLPPRPLMAVDIAIISSLVQSGRPRYPVLVHRAAVLLHASFRPRLVTTPLRFANLKRTSTSKLLIMLGTQEKPRSARGKS